MRNKRSKEFRKLLARLSLDVQKQAKDAYHLFRTNPYHPSLHFKRIDPKEPIYSVRIGRSYRAVGEWRDDTILWVWIGSHEDYNHLTK